jgi:hypothetical protein
MSRTDRRGCWLVALAALAGYTILVLIAVQGNGGVAWFAKFGTDPSAVNARGRELLGDDLPTPYVEKHDGTQFWIVARDPLLRDPTSMTPYLDAPAYRAERILYPLVASPWRLGGEQMLLWGLVVTNLAVVFAGTWITARLGVQLGRDARLGLAFALNPLVLISVFIDVADAMQLAALVGTVFAVRRNRWGWAIALAVAAVLAKEVAILSLVGIAVVSRREDRARAAALVAVPGVVFGAWLAYVHTRLPATGDANLTGPFFGYLDAARDFWVPRSDLVQGLVALAGLVMAIVVVQRFITRRTPEMGAAVLPALMTPFLSSMVLGLSINSLRVTGVMVTFLALDATARPRRQPTARRKPGPELLQEL